MEYGIGRPTHFTGAAKMSGAYPDGVNQRIHDRRSDQLGPGMECPECGKTNGREGICRVRPCDWSVEDH